MATRWLAERIDVLLTRLAPLGGEQEEEIAQLCAQEIAAWRARPSIQKESSLKTPMKDTRNAIRSRLALTEGNRWFNAREGQYEHLALKYMNFTDEEWVRINGDTTERFHQRLASRQFLDQPEVLVQMAETFLESQHWSDLALGLAIATGRRITEILKTGKFFPKTSYTVIFEGQLKRQDLVLKPYEIPTLVPAHLVLSAWEHLRMEVHCEELSNDEVNNTYGSTVRALANERLSGIIPLRSDRESVTTHLNRCVYGRLAVHYFAPEWVSDIAYMATVYGHYWQKDEQSEPQLNYQSTLHYYDYVIGDGQGNIDGRQGLRLGEPGVEVLDQFRRSIPIKEEKKKSMATETQGEQMPTIAVKKHSIVRCSQATSARFAQAARERGFFKNQNGLLSQLLDESYLFRQVQELLQPVATQLGTNDVIGTLQELIQTTPATGVEHSALDHHLQERWGVSLEQVDRLFEMTREAGYDDLLEVLREGVVTRQKQKGGALKRHESFSKKDFSHTPYPQLKDIRASAAAEERIRRAVLAIMKHNQRSQPVDRWYINAMSINGLIHTRFPLIQAYLEKHQQETDAHHQQFGIEPRYNRSKLVPIHEMISIPDLPEE